MTRIEHRFFVEIVADITTRNKRTNLNALERHTEHFCGHL